MHIALCRYARWLPTILNSQKANIFSHAKYGKTSRYFFLFFEKKMFLVKVLWLFCFQYFLMKFAQKWGKWFILPFLTISAISWAFAKITRYRFLKSKSKIEKKFFWKKSHFFKVENEKNILKKKFDILKKTSCFFGFLRRFGEKSFFQIFRIFFFWNFFFHDFSKSFAPFFGKPSRCYDDIYFLKILEIA